MEICFFFHDASPQPAPARPALHETPPLPPEDDSQLVATAAVHDLLSGTRPLIAAPPTRGSAFPYAGTVQQRSVAARSGAVSLSSCCS
jgi:hypothetical protein